MKLNKKTNTKTDIKTKISNLDKIFIVIAIVLCSMPILLQMGVISASSTVLYIGKCMAFAIVAIAIDLIWGYTGILSLGHGLYFALGGYAMAMYLKLIETGGAITDFMRVGGLEELPLVWVPFQYAIPSFLLVFIVPAIVAWIVGYFIFKNRVKGVYFSIISQALTWAAYSLFIALSPYTNGNTGITEISSIFGNIKGNANIVSMMKLYYLTVVLLVVTYFVARYITTTKFGKLLVAIRDGENRTYFSGYKVSSFKNVIYVISAAMSGMAGAIFVNFNGSITPSQMTIQYSIMMVIWVAVGGRGTILGAVIGAFLINLCEYNLSSGNMVEIWQYIIGAGFTITIIFFKGGVVGVVSDFFHRRKAKSKEEGGELCEN